MHTSANVYMCACVCIDPRPHAHAHRRTLCATHWQVRRARPVRVEGAAGVLEGYSQGSRGVLTGYSRRWGGHDQFESKARLTQYITNNTVVVGQVGTRVGTVRSTQWGTL